MQTIRVNDDHYGLQLCEELQSRCLNSLESQGDLSNNVRELLLYPTIIQLKKKP